MQLIRETRSQQRKYPVGLQSTISTHPQGHDQSAHGAPKQAPFLWHFADTSAMVQGCVERQHEATSRRWHECLRHQGRKCRGEKRGAGPGEGGGSGGLTRKQRECWDGHRLGGHADAHDLAVEVQQAQQGYHLMGGADSVNDAIQALGMCLQTSK